jgi:DNA processing protein
VTTYSDCPDDDCPPEACAAALAGLDRMTVARLRTLLRHLDPVDAWRLVSGHCGPREVGRLPGSVVALVREHGQVWRSAALDSSPSGVWRACKSAGVGVSVLGRPGYPAQLAVDHEAPAVLFHRGDLGVLASGRRRVGIVGTRNATASGRATASRMAADLADHGIDIVSGLARGIDGAAHRGMLADPEREGRAIGVVASGLDVVYPRDNAALWQQVAERGLLLGEAPPGTAPHAFRFPLRNRIIAALSEVLVVVESRAAGGSLLTVEAARRRQVTVLVVPGSAANAAAAGTNALARDGCGLALDAADVLCALGLDSRRSGRLIFDPRPMPSGLDRTVLDAIGDDACELDSIVRRAGRPLGEVAIALGRLEASGWLQHTGGWFERVDTPVTWG